jgi:hypothetical protein
MKNLIIAVLLLALIGLGAFLFMKRDLLMTPPPVETPVVVATSTPTTTEEVAEKPTTIIGTSVGGHDITAYHYGTGTKEVLFVGGIHGGYEWNTSLLAYELMDYLTQNPQAIPQDIKVTVIPVLNPDGLSKVVADPLARFAAADITASQAVQISGRTNANNVDLNRNFDCDWKSEGTWRSAKVSGGAAPFSEPESIAFKNYIEEGMPTGVVFWFSSAGGVYASSCGDATPAGMAELTETYAEASGYPAHDDFTSYAVTGDVTNWLAKIGVPSISVLLTDHENTEWAKNWRGIQATLTLLSR